MAEVEVQSEVETQAGWVFTVLVRAAASAGSPAPAPSRGPRSEHPAGSLADASTPSQETRHEVSLSWVDYEHWSHGRVAPERVARAVVESLIDAQWLPLPPRFDAATARRWLAHLDDAVRARL